MLYHIPSIITPELLYAMRAMGHGDELLITDANFPATSHGRECIRLSGVNSSEALSAILTLLPIDTFVENPFITMETVDHPEIVPPTVEDFTQIILKKPTSPPVQLGLSDSSFTKEPKKPSLLFKPQTFVPTRISS
ncbi:ribose ABC transporter [Marinomonas pontica]|nr:RbsD/FucU domain-containing protein [Marinomonas pontica]MCW8355601.1 ribose ABC transporter [Marinomonas pontica]